MKKKFFIYLILIAIILIVVFLFILKKKAAAPIDSLISQIKQPTASIIFTGDTMLSRWTAKQIYENNDLYFPFKNVSDFLKSANLVFTNLESPIINGRKIQTGEMVFRIDENLIPVLKEMKISLVNLANNHMLDFYQKGLSNTLKILSDNQISYIGAGKDYNEAHQPKIIEINKIKFAFLGYNDADVAPPNSNATETQSGTAIMNIDNLKTDLENAKLQNPDFIIVSMHSGTEYENLPNQRQIDFAHTAIDNGANLIIGHHPHVVQNIEKYNNGYVFYSLGNFIFDQMWSENTRQGIALKIDFSKKEIKKIEIVPYLIENYSQPKITTQETNPTVYNEIIKNLKIPQDEKITISQ